MLDPGDRLPINRLERDIFQSHSYITDGVSPLRTCKNRVRSMFPPLRITPTSPGQVERIVAVDVNPDYVKQTGSRHTRRLKRLELHCADVQSESLQFAPVDLMYAALLFEYVDVSLTLRTLKRKCRTGAILAAVLQLPNSHQQPVSLSPYTSLSTLAPAIVLLAPEDFRRSAVTAGFSPAGSEFLESPSGKQFWVETLRS